MIATHTITESKPIMASDANRARYALVYTDYISRYIRAIHDALTDIHSDVQDFLRQYQLPYPLLDFTDEVNFSRINECALNYVWAHRSQISLIEWDACIDIYKDIPKANVGGRATHAGATYIYYSDETYELAFDLGYWMSNAEIRVPRLVTRGKPSLKAVSNVAIIHTGRIVTGEAFTSKR